MTTSNGVVFQRNFGERIKYRKLWFAIAVQFGVSVFSVNADEINIQKQTLADALAELSKQTNLQLMFPYGDLKAIKTPGVLGEMPAKEALEILLAGTEFGYKFTSDNTVVVKKLNAADSLEGSSESSKREIRPNKNEIEEMIVTATKREASVQDLPMSITAIGRDEIERRGLVGMEDYLSSVPAANVMDQGPGRFSIVVRGLSVDPQVGSGSITGVYFGEIPVSGNGRGGNSADVKLVDIERIEVLRGPQGTLYGSSTMGGTVRSIPVAPNLNEWEGKVNLNYSDTEKFGGDNSKMDAVINLPVVKDMLGLRVVAYKHSDSGFIKNIAGDDAGSLDTVAAYGAVAVNDDDIGANDTFGGRVTVLWQPTDHLSVSLMHLMQDTDQNGWAQADLALGSYLQNRFRLRDASNPTAPVISEPVFGEVKSDELQVTNLTLDYDLGWASVMSSTSTLDEDYESMRDLSAASFSVPLIPFSQINDGDSSAFVEEIRLVSQLDGPFQFLTGYYYEESKKHSSNWLVHGGDAATNPFAPGELLLLNGPHGTSSLKQHAISGEVSWQAMDTIKFTLGARVFDYDRKNKSENYESVFNATQRINELDSDERGTNFKANIDFTPNENSLVYLLWSEGFRLGRPLAAELRPDVCDVDGDGFYDGSIGVSVGERQIDSDYVENYELGSKFTLLDNRLQVNTAVFMLNWEGMPVIASFDNGCGTLLNAGTARSLGVEFESNFQFSEKLLASIRSSYVNAELTRDAVNLGSAGDRLPGSPKFNFSVGLQYDFQMAGYDAFIRGDYSYVGGFYNNLQQEGVEIADYSKVNLRGGVFWGDFNFDIYVNNLLNDDSLTWIDSEFTKFGIGQRGYYLRPRTIGLNVGYSF